MAVAIMAERGIGVGIGIGESKFGSIFFGVLVTANTLHALTKITPHSGLA